MNTWQYDAFGAFGVFLIIMYITNHFPWQGMSPLGKVILVGLFVLCVGSAFSAVNRYRKRQSL